MRLKNANYSFSVVKIARSTTFTHSTYQRTTSLAHAALQTIFPHREGLATQITVYRFNLYARRVQAPPSLQSWAFGYDYPLFMYRIRTD